MSWADFKTFEHHEASPRPGPVVHNDESTFRAPTAVNPTFADALVAQLPGLRRYAIALVGNAALADDLVQDCIERALGQEAQLRETERLAGWLRRILHNLYIDKIRRDRRRGREHDITELADHLELSTPAPDNSAMREFIHAVNRLSIEHRQILLLVSVEELSYREIADELEIPLGTVMSRLARARERLRSLMQSDTAEIISLADRKANT
jgi:RNA polymerase sigma-70 factor (ECF subfamily)